MKGRSRGSPAPGRPAQKSVRHVPDNQIDFSDIPEVSEAQLSRAVKVGRPPYGETAKQLIAIRIDQILLRRIRALAAEKGLPYQTFIHRILERSLARQTLKR